MLCRTGVPALEKEVVMVEWHIWLGVVGETNFGLNFDPFGHVVRKFLCPFSSSKIKAKKVSACA